MNITEIPVQGFEKVVHAVDPESGLNAFISVYSTALGPACGGTRMLPYESEASALEDVNRLAIAMTYKSAIANTGLGGGKAVIIGDPKTKTEPLLRAMGRFIDSLGGMYITAEDMNMTVPDLEIMRQETRWVAGVSRELGSSGNPAPFTAQGCYLGMKACANEIFGSPSLAGRTIAIQGIGAVGARLAELCLDEGAVLAVSDIDPEKTARLAKSHGCAVIPSQDEFLACPCDILSPCARGELFDARAIPDLNCRIIAGSANNQLCTIADAERIHQRGILYAPDYVVNAGGIINIACEFLPGGYEQAVAQQRVNHIADAITDIIKIAKNENISTSAAARHLAEERLARARRP